MGELLTMKQMEDQIMFLTNCDRETANTIANMCFNCGFKTALSE